MLLHFIACVVASLIMMLKTLYDLIAVSENGKQLLAY